jgi:hypothetical protein
MTIEEFEQLMEQQIDLEEVEYINYSVGIVKFKDKHPEYETHIVTEDKTVVGFSYDPLKSILKAIFQL